jgi:hypothetical protein
LNNAKKRTKIKEKNTKINTKKIKQAKTKQKQIIPEGLRCSGKVSNPCYK